MRKQRKRSGRSIVMFLVLCLGLVAAFYYFLHSSVFFIEKITVTGNQAVPTQEIITFAGISTGKNIFEFNLKASQKAIEVIPRIKQATISRHFPNRVEIRVVERKPWAYVIHTGSVLLIDNEGICLDKLDTMGETGLPVISIAKMTQEVQKGQQVNKTAIELVRGIADALPSDLLEEVSEFHYSDLGQVVVFTLDGTEVRLGGKDRIDEKISLWRRVIAMQEEKDSQVGLEYIDLRFRGQPVIQEKS
ncbi:MAG: cell division protein FtsQ/DivIB [Syntrophomonadales bacterium]|jgi:cell division protein FtsQ